MQNQEPQKKLLTIMTARQNVLLVLQLVVLELSRAAEQGVCISQHGFKFNPIKPVRKAYSRPLSYCKLYEGSTCCNKTHTDHILR
jgi:hypothetical protein